MFCPMQETTLKLKAREGVMDTPQVMAVNARKVCPVSCGLLKSSTPGV